MTFPMRLLGTSALVAMLTTGPALASGQPRMMELRTSDFMHWSQPITRIERVEPAGSGFHRELFKGYKRLALSEAHEMYDFDSANYFALKGLVANENRPTPPEAPTSWRLPVQYIAEMQGAYDELVSVLDQGAGEKFPALAAKAQLSYDCWVEQQQENHQAADIDACKTGYHNAMAALQEAMQPPPPPAPKPQAAAPAPEPQPRLVLGDEVARTVIFFGWDRAAIDPMAQAKLDAFVKRMRPMKDIVLLVDGHADRSGSAAYNERLSERRAENARAELTRQGMTVVNLDAVRIQGHGERQPAIPTADGVRELANRRVEIVARGLVQKLARADAPTTTTQR